MKLLVADGVGGVGWFSGATARTEPLLLSLVSLHYVLGVRVIPRALQNHWETKSYRTTLRGLCLEDISWVMGKGVYLAENSS